MVEVERRVGGPQAIAQSVARHHLTGVFEQSDEELEGLILKAHSDALPSQFAGVEVHLEHSKLLSTCLSRCHQTLPLECPRHASGASKRMQPTVAALTAREVKRAQWFVR